MAVENKPKTTSIEYILLINDAIIHSIQQLSNQIKSLSVDNPQSVIGFHPSFFELNLVHSEISRCKSFIFYKAIEDKVRFSLLQPIPSFCFPPLFSSLFFFFFFFFLNVHILFFFFPYFYFVPKLNEIRILQIIELLTKEMITLLFSTLLAFPFVPCFKK